MKGERAVRGTALFERTLSFDYGDTERGDLMSKVWAPTPWMADVYSGRVNSDTYRAMMEWCRANMGDECSPIHGRPGDWQSGAATVFGWTWFGFAREEQLGRFLAAFPSRPVPEDTGRE